MTLSEATIISSQGMFVWLNLRKETNPFANIINLSAIVFSPTSCLSETKDKRCAFVRVLCLNWNACTTSANCLTKSNYVCLAATCVDSLQQVHRSTRGLSLSLSLSFFSSLVAPRSVVLWRRLVILSAHVIFLSPKLPSALELSIVRRLNVFSLPVWWWCCSPYHLRLPLSLLSVSLLFSHCALMFLREYLQIVPTTSRHVCCFCLSLSSITCREASRRLIESMWLDLSSYLVLDAMPTTTLCQP